MVHRVATSDNEWQRVTTNEHGWYNEWQRVVQRVTTSDNEWEKVITNEKEWQQMTMSDSEWQQVLQQMKTAQYPSENGWLPSFLWQKQILLQGMDGCN